MSFASLRPIVALAIVIGAFNLTTPAAQAQTIFFDTFNAETGALNYTNFANWNVARGSVDTVGFYSGQGLSVDMDGSSGAAGLLTTKTAFNLAAGDYTLSFGLGKNGSAAETMVVSVGNVFSTTLSDSLAYPSLITQTYNFTIGTATTGVISFDHRGGDNQGYVIDNVSLVRANAVAAPEPGSIALLLTAGIPMVGLVRRKKN